MRKNFQRLQSSLLYESTGFQTEDFRVSTETFDGQYHAIMQIQIPRVLLLLFSRFVVIYWFSTCVKIFSEMYKWLLDNGITKLYSVHSMVPKQIKGTPKEKFLAWQVIFQDFEASGSMDLYGHLNLPVFRLSYSFYHWFFIEFIRKKWIFK